MFKSSNSAFEGTPSRSTYSPAKELQNSSQRASRNKMMSLLKRIAQLELREGKYIEKIKYLEAVNLRLSCEHHQQLQLMSRHPTSELEELIKNLQDEVRKSSTRQQSALENSRQRDVWFRKYHQLIDSSTKSLEEQRKGRLELEYQNKYLKTRVSDLERQQQQAPTDDSAAVKKLEQEKHELIKENEQLKKRRGELEAQYVRLQGQIEEKFAFLEEQISLYEVEKAANMDKIRALKQELSIRESRHYFSFSNKNMEDRADEITQTDEQEEQYDVSIYKTSIDSLLEQNSRLKQSLQMMQQLGIGGNQMPKQLEIEYQLGRRNSDKPPTN